MIRSHSITYDAIESSLLTWKVENNILQSILVAFITTVLSYQMTAIMFDVLVGFKSKGKASVTDLASVIITQGSSLLSAAANVSQSDRLWIWRLKGQGLEISEKTSRKAIITFPVWIKFGILFCIAPVLQLLVIVVSLERDSIVTFDDVKFGGIALGFAQNQSLDFTRENEECFRLKIGHTSHEIVTASFHLCHFALQASGSVSNTTTLSASKTAREEILIRLDGPESRFEMLVSADVRISGNIYRLRARFFEEEGRKLISLGYPILTGACRNRSMEQSMVVNSVGAIWNISQVIPCMPRKDSVDNAFQEFLNSVTVVDADDFSLVPISKFNSSFSSLSNDIDISQNFVQGGNLPFLRRRRSVLSFAILCILAAASLVFRIILRCLTRNDIKFGIESTVKAAVGVDCRESMLQNRSVLDFRRFHVE